MRSTLRLLAVLVLAALGAAACGDNPAGSPGARETAQIGFSLNVTGTEIHLLVVEVTAPDITSRLVFNVPVQNGAATGTFAIPAGAARTVAVRAYDAQGALTHEGSATVDVKPGSNPPLTVTLVPRPGHLPVSVGFGSYVVHVWSEAVLPPGGALPGQSWHLAAEVRDLEGNAVPGAAVRWATADPSVATVNENGWVTAQAPGAAEVVATYEGHGGAILVTVAGGSGPGGSDTTAPDLLGASMGPQTLFLEGTGGQLFVSLQVRDMESGVSAVSADLRGPTVDGGVVATASCQNTASVPPGTAAVVSCTVSLPWFAPAGIWTLDAVRVTDGAGNERLVGTTELALRGMAPSSEIANPNSDTTAPTLVSVTLGQTQIAPGSILSVQVRATDARAGIPAVEVQFRGDQGTWNTCWAYPTGTPDLFHCNLFVPSTATGEWRLTGVTLTDHANNYRFLGEAELVAMGQAPRFTVVP